MQIFDCPFCGERDETEFHFVSEAGKVRPEPACQVSADTWAAYLHVKQNVKGAGREVWRHLSCGELFVMQRDTTSMVVIAVESLRKSRP